MAEVAGLVSSIIAVLDLSAKVVSKCKAIIETAKNAPRDLRTILVEVSSLNSALESLEFLSRIDCEFAKDVSNQQGVEAAVQGCRHTLTDLVDQLGSLSLSDAHQTGPNKRQQVKTAISWTWRESTAKKLLADILQHKTTIMLGLLTHTAREVHETKLAVDKVQERLSEDQNHKIWFWLEQTNPSVNHNLAQKVYESHTCEWITRMPQWTCWLQSPETHRFLWIHGIPGAGKTILASFLIEQCKLYRMTTPKNSSCVYYYCSYRNNQDESIPLLRWMICQLSRLTSRIPKNLYDVYRSNQHPNTKTLMGMLAELLEDMVVVYLIVDAVDESRPRDELLLLFEELVTNPLFSKIQLLVTSRRYHDIESALTGLSIPISMNNDEVDKDIRVFVTSQLDRKFIGWRAAHKPSILEALVHKAKGMFRLAVCQIEILLKKRTAPDLYESLKHLPETIEDSYEMILLDIEKEDWASFRTILSWIYANDKLPKKMQIPVDILCSMLSRNSAGINGMNSIYNLENINDICGCLVTIERHEEDCYELGVDAKYSHTLAGFDSVRYSHYTVIEYLFSDRIRQGKASYFALSEDDAVDAFLQIVLEVAMETEEVQSVTDKYWTGLKHYCSMAAFLAPIIWEHKIVQTERFWTALKQVWLTTESYFPHMSPLSLGEVWHSEGPFDGSMEWDILDSEALPVIRRTLTVTTTCLLINKWSAFARRLSIENTSRIFSDTPYYFYWPWPCDYTPPRFALEDICLGSAIEAIVLYCIRYEVDEPLQDAISLMNHDLDTTRVILICIALHFYEAQACCGSRTQDEDDCCYMIQPLRKYDYQKEITTYCFTPLQLAVNCWDYLATKALLETGADPNGLGTAGGESVPIHIYKIDASWGTASPLHILRHAGFAPMKLDSLLRITIGREVSKDREVFCEKIEALLISYGATDFVRLPSQDTTQTQLSLLT